MNGRWWDICSKWPAKRSQEALPREVHLRSLFILRLWATDDKAARLRWTTSAAGWPANRSQEVLREKSASARFGEATVDNLLRRLVELMGIKPTTSAMRMRRSIS